MLNNFHHALPALNLGQLFLHVRRFLDLLHSSQHTSRHLLFHVDFLSIGGFEISFLPSFIFWKILRIRAIAILPWTPTSPNELRQVLSAVVAHKNRNEYDASSCTKTRYHGKFRSYCRFNRSELPQAERVQYQFPYSHSFVEYLFV